MLCWRDGLNRPGNPYWPANWRERAPHELVGKLPKAFAPTCGRTATSSGRPCRVRVAMYGDACSASRRDRIGKDPCMTTGPEARQIGLGRALEEFQALLAKWHGDDQPIDIDDLTRLTV